MPDFLVCLKYVIVKDNMVALCGLICLSMAYSEVRKIRLPDRMISFVKKKKSSGHICIMPAP